VSRGPEIIRAVADMQAWSRGHREAGRRIGLVPTMGNLHEGHLSLARMAMDESDRVIVSLFVNPTPFGPGEDYDSYPRTWDEDLDKLRELGVHYVFAPKLEEIYPAGDHTRVLVNWGQDVLCGATRPGHFDGVTTVVAKLFNATLPDLAYFGQKDAQQALIIRRMVRTLAFPLILRLGETVRETDGLAKSSRNAYLSVDDRAKARCLNQALDAAGAALESGERDPAVLEAAGMEALEGLAPEYFSVLDPDTLGAPARLEDGLVLIACALPLGTARLIDNHVYRINENRVEKALLF
jgi:pantoate--beta-alanine ligase